MLDVTHNSVYSIAVIVTYRDKRTREFARGKRIKAFAGFEHKAEMKLDQLDAAASLLDLNLPGTGWKH
jgi:proteic killer suppression protein